MERVKGLEPSTYTLARYRSSQLSYTRELNRNSAVLCEYYFRFIVSTVRGRKPLENIESLKSPAKLHS
jgi:hypothetical protein